MGGEFLHVSHYIDDDSSLCSLDICFFCCVYNDSELVLRNGELMN